MNDKSQLYDHMKNWRKAKNGQVFTPLHMANFAADLIGISENDKVLDAGCGSGALLYAAYEHGVKAIYGIEFDPEVMKLAEENYADIDIESEFLCEDAMSENASNWIKQKQPTKALLNPPYERKYGCMKIVKNVLDSLKPGTKVAIFLPDRKFEKESKKYQKEFKEHHCIEKIIKMPTNLFYGFSVEVSIFIIEIGKPQTTDIYTAYIEDDGLVSMKNQSPKDVKGVWEYEKKDKYFKCVSEEDTDGPVAQELDAKYIDSNEHLSYQAPEKPFEIHQEDFQITALNYLCFKNGIDLKELYGISGITYNFLHLMDAAKIGINLCDYYKAIEDKDKTKIEINLMDYFYLAQPFENAEKINGSIKEVPEGDTPVIGGGRINNGIQDFKEVDPQYEKCLTINSLCGVTFYHHYPFAVSGHAVHVLKAKEPIPPMALKYFSVLLTQKLDNGRYGFGNNLKKEELERLKIVVPATEFDKPDWTYMAMKAIEYQE